MTDRDGELPFFSILVPTHERPDALAACLSSLAALDYPRERFEVVVVDDGGDSTPESALAPFRERLDLRVVAQPHSGPAAARNRAAQHARGRFLAFTDDDCAPTPGWLRALARRFAEAPDRALTGLTENVLDNPFSAASQALVDHLYAYYNADPHDARFAATNNFAIPAETFRALGGFDTSFPLAGGEDREFCTRLIRNGHRIAYAEDAVVHHAHALDFARFWRQHRNYGYGSSQYHDLTRGALAGRRSPEPLRFYLDLVRFPLSRRRDARALVTSALLLVSQLATAVGVLRYRLERARARRATPA